MARHVFACYIATGQVKDLGPVREFLWELERGEFYPCNAERLLESILRRLYQQDIVVYSIAESPEECHKTNHPDP
jgi:hypothetical protein